MRKVTVHADFGKSMRETIKPLHGVNNSPLELYEPPKGFREAGFPFCRLHDAAGGYGGAHFVDIPNVFPDFEADPRCPESYDFALTDAYLAQIHASGTQIFYRLGVTIENNYRIRGYHNHPPEDFERWAEICAGVVRHYNCGWANGFRFGIRYWEIWNEPENPPLWSGSREAYFELYRITSIRLKREFPEIRVGGYGSCGFYAVNRPGCTDFYKGFVTWYDEFLKYVTAEKTRCPLDFYSWHLYTDDPEEVILHARYVDAKLKQFGLNEVENIFDEWNYYLTEDEDRFLKMKENEGASFVGAAFCLMQGSPIDKAMYYDAYPQRNYCGLYYFPGPRTTRTYSAFRMWNALYRLGGRRVAEAEGKNVYVCAAANRSNKALFLSNFSPTGCRVMLTLAGARPEEFRGVIVDRRHDAVPVTPETEMVLPPYSVLLLTTEGEEKGERGEKAAKGKKRTVAHAGLDDAAAAPKPKRKRFSTR